MKKEERSEGASIPITMLSSEIGSIINSNFLQQSQDESQSQGSNS